VEVERFEAGEVGQYVQLAGESVAVKLEPLERSGEAEFVRERALESAIVRCWR
jgi:hypothetical protein